MLFKIILLPLSFLFIVGTAKKCRDWDNYGFYEDEDDESSTSHVPKEICCSGYQNVSGRCEPLCIPPCAKGTCTHPDTCECIDGWYGDRCLNPCPTNRYGSNCLQECQCEGCRKTDGYCKCQEGWKGTDCTDYCPIRFYDTSNNKCINRAEIVSSNLLYSIIGMVIIAGIVILVAVIVYLKRRKPRHAGMVNINATKITVPLPKTPISNDYEKETYHIYEIVPDKPDETPKRIENPAYYDGYEIPNAARVPKTQPSFSGYDTVTEVRL